MAGLLAAGASCDVRDAESRAPLHLAAQLCDQDIFNLIYAQPTSSAIQLDAHGNPRPPTAQSLRWLSTEQCELPCGADSPVLGLLILNQKSDN